MEQTSGTPHPAAPTARTERRNFLGKLVAVLAGGTVFAGLVRAHAQSGEEKKQDVLQALPRTPNSLQGLDPFVGEIAMVGFNFAPTGWAQCNGQILPISQYTALFSLLGTMYGGDGVTNFALPNFQGRVPVHLGAGITQGNVGGETSHTLSAAEMPAHAHSLRADAGVGTSDSPANGLPAKNGAGIPQYSTGTGTTMNANAVTPSGSSYPHNNMPPYTCVNFIISLQGVYPSRP